MKGIYSLLAIILALCIFFLLYSFNIRNNNITNHIDEDIINIKMLSEISLESESYLHRVCKLDSNSTIKLQEKIMKEISSMKDDCMAVVHLEEQSGSVFTLPGGTSGCLMIGVNNQNDEAISMIVSLISKLEIVPTYEGFCRKTQMTIICWYHFQSLSFTGLYNISIRSNFCQIPSNLTMTYHWPLESLGISFGGKLETVTKYLYQINVTSNATSKEYIDDIPSCTFDHENKLSSIGNPRWSKNLLINDDEKEIRKIWYNDSYIWGNDLCIYKSIKPIDFVKSLKSKGIRSILLVGDSLSRYIFNDFEDYFKGVTQEWLENHPYTITDELMGEWSNWDGIKSGWIEDGIRLDLTNCIGQTTGLCNDQNGDVKVLSERCEPEGPTISYQEFLPRANEVPNSAEEEKWMNFLSRYFEGRPSIIIFNVGLWLLHFPNPIAECKTIIKVMADLCSLHSVILIWRSTLYQHHQATSNIIKRMNKESIKILRDRPNVYIIDSVFAMSTVRPDRTVDGFHYSYRKIIGKWHYCSEEDYLHPFNLDCIRDTKWPQSVTRAATLLIINLLYNSEEVQKF